MYSPQVDLVQALEVVPPPQVQQLPLVAAVTPPLPWTLAGPPPPLTPTNTD